MSSNKECEEELCALLFEISNVDRMRLLSLIKTESGKLSQLAQRSSATPQETSRHLERLHQSGLVQREAMGDYQLSSIGKIVQEVLPSIGFSIKNKQYLLNHELSYLPQEFLERIGELTGSEYGRYVSIVIQHTQDVISKAKEYVWLMADQPFLSLRELRRMLLDSKSGITPRLIFPSSIRESVQHEITELDLKSWEFRFVDEVRVAIAVNEAETGVCFEDLKGKLDMSCGFKGSDLIFRKWCCDLFLHYWEGRSEGRTIPLNFEF
jgi:predicted transcriptional regulator